MKVIGFDSWTGGVRNFERLINAFDLRAINFFVLHTESWSDAAIAHELVIDNVLYRDVSYYGTLDPLDILTLEKPDLVLFLSTDTFAHRAVNRFCNFHGIPTIHLYHGLLSVQSLKSGEAQFKIGLSWLLFILERVPKALLLVWPLYVKSLFLTSARAYDWWRFFSDIFIMSSGRLVVKAAPDAKASKCLVFANADISYAVSHNGYLLSEVITVGNPDFDRFGVLKSDICSYVPEIASGNNIIYIDTGLVYGGFVFDSISQFTDHLLNLDQMLLRAGYSLKLKLHPDHYRSSVFDNINALGLDVIEESSFSDALKSASAIIVEPTSLAFLPCSMGIPVLLAAFGQLQGQRYGEFLSNYPRARILESLDELSVLIDDCNSVSSEAVYQWCSDNIGSPSEGRMPSRVVDIILETVIR